MASQDFQKHSLSVCGVLSGRNGTRAEPDPDSSTSRSSWASSTKARTWYWLTSLPEPTGMTGMISAMLMPEGDGSASGALRVSSTTSYDSAEGAQSDLSPAVQKDRDGWKRNFITTIPHHLIWTFSDAQCSLVCNLDMTPTEEDTEEDDISRVPFEPTQWIINRTTDPARCYKNGTIPEKVLKETGYCRWVEKETKENRGLSSKSRESP